MRLRNPPPYWLIVLIVLLWLFIFFFVFPIPVHGETNPLLPQNAVAIVYSQGLAHFISASNPTILEEIYQSQQPSIAIEAGKYTSIGSAAVATFFSGVALAIPPAHPVFNLTRLGAEALAVVFSGISIGSGIAANYFQSLKPKLNWRFAYFYSLDPRNKFKVNREKERGDLYLEIFDEKHHTVHSIFTFTKVLVIIKNKNFTPEDIFRGKVLFYQGKPLLRNLKLQKGKSISFDASNEYPVVIY